MGCPDIFNAHVLEGIDVRFSAQIYHSFISGPVRQMYSRHFKMNLTISNNSGLGRAGPRPTAHYSWSKHKILSFCLCQSERIMELKKPMYVPFVSVPKEQKTILLIRLASDLRKASELNEGMNRFLEALSETIRKAENRDAGKGTTDKADKIEDSIELKFDVSYNSELDVYAWSFNGFNDFAMIKYARKYNFPRGCIVIWKEGKSIDLRGFYPKVFPKIVQGPLEIC